jgi:signal peptidase complex subunit 3
MTDFSANRKKNDLGVLQLNLDMNFNHLFDWNVKQLFLYLIAEYVTPGNVSFRLDLILK